MLHKYDLRCCFEYIGKPTWRSQWNRSGHLPCDQAWCQNKNGLAFAVIEGKDVQTREVIRLVECSGDTFNNFEWLAHVSIPLGVKGEVTPPVRNVGLVLVTSENRIIITVDGVMQMEQRTTEDKAHNFAGFGR
jgi:hypothetical protein